jgi:ribosomal-protein-alanine N-acetyltransferase
MHLNTSKVTLDKFPVLHSKRLNLIEIENKQLTDIYKIFGNEDVTKFYSMKALKKESDAQKTINWFKKRYLDKTGMRWGLAIKGQEGIIGTIGFNNILKDHRASIGYDLQAEHWNSGYMSEAVSTIIRYGFNNLEISRIDAEVMEGNWGSEKILEKLHFKNEGILKDWMHWDDKYYDVTMYSLLRTELIPS